MTRPLVKGFCCRDNFGCKLQIKPWLTHSILFQVTNRTTAYIINLKMSIKLTVVFIILPNIVINLYVKMMNSCLVKCLWRKLFCVVLGGGRGEKKKRKVEVAPLPHHFPSSNTVATQSGHLSNDMLKLLSSAECVYKRALEAHNRVPISSEKSARSYKTVNQTLMSRIAVQMR